MAALFVKILRAEEKSVRPVSAFEISDIDQLDQKMWYAR